jgi:hypothetical protein
MADGAHRCAIIDKYPDDYRSRVLSSLARLGRQGRGNPAQGGNEGDRRPPPMRSNNGTYI